MKCPICKTNITDRVRHLGPFCSTKCQGKDLGNWMTEEYKVTVEVEEELSSEDLDYIENN